MPTPNPTAYVTQILSVVQSTVQGLSLVYTNDAGQAAALPSGQVYTKKLFTDRGVALPCVEVFYGNLASEVDYEGTDFEDTVLEVPIGLAVVFASNQDASVNNDELYWLQQILPQFLDFPDSLRTGMEEGVEGASVWDCRVQLAPPVNPGDWHDQNLDVGGMVLRFKITISRERN